MRKLLILLIFPISASAEFSYDYIQFGVSSVDDVLDGSAISISGFKSLNDYLYIGAGHTKIGYEMDIKSKATMYGIGTRHGLSEKTDIYGQILNMDVSITYGFITLTDDAKQYQIGIRHDINGLELGIHTESTRYSDVTYNSSGIYAIKPLKNYDIGARYATEDKASLVGLFVRSSF